jgi:hypothetical protein
LWQPEEDLAHAQETIQDFYRDRKGAPESQEKRKRGGRKIRKVVEMSLA